MSRFIALAASAMLLSLTPVAPAMADEGLAQPTIVLSQQIATQAVATTAPVVGQPALYAPITSLASTGLGGGAIIFGGIAVAGFAGLVALAASDDDDTLEATPTTN